MPSFFWKGRKVMTTLKINGTDYNVKYGYEAVVKNGIIRKLIEVEQGNDTEKV